MAQMDWQLLTEHFDLVIFDCDGVLVDSEVLSCRCLADALGREGLAMSADEAMERFLGRSIAAVATHFRAATGRDLSPSFHSELQARLTETFRRDLKVFPLVPEVLAACGERYCLASSSSPERLAMTLAAVGLDRHFAGRAYTASMVARAKPAPDIFLLAAREMAVRPERALVIEDSVNGVVAGKAAGMTVWGFIGGSHYRGRDGAALLKEAGADRVFAAFADILPEAASAR
jgi:HAD superfamily hydrolase (TIGR01509 family)